MTLRKFSALLAFVAIASGGHPPAAQADQPKQAFEKKIFREFTIAPSGTTAIYNKYGDVTVKAWENRSVKIDITIIVNAPDRRTADRTFERIQVNFLHTADYVKAETVIEPDSRLSFTFFDRSAVDFKVHYCVWLPAQNQLDLKNRYGNARVSNLSGPLTAEIRYGNLVGERLGSDADLSLGYADATFDQLHRLTGYVSYSHLKVDRAGEVSLDMRYSELRIAQAKEVRLISKYDKFSFDQVETLRLQTRYSELRARQLSSLFLTAQYTDTRLERVDWLLDADLTYSQLAVTVLGRQFSEARLQGKYTDVKMGVEAGTAFRLEAQGKQLDVRAPSLAHLSRREDQPGVVRVSGFAGNAKAQRLITAQLQNSDFVLK